MSEGNAPSWSNWLGQRSDAIEGTLDALLPAASARPKSIHRAIRHAIFSGGKRIRPGLVLLGFEGARGKGDAGVRLGAAIEMLHTFSLIHDDLPCMDDDDTRRGRPTVHRIFGEAIAVLAGDALQVLAFETVAELPISADRRIRVLAEITRAVGTHGVIGGQVIDIESEGKKVPAETLKWIHRHKTGELMRASLVGGGLAAGARPAYLESLARFGESFGLLFQIVDDLLDEVGSSGKLGRPLGRDRESGKATYPSILGLPGSRRALGRSYADCVGCIPAGADQDVFAGLLVEVVARLPEDWHAPLLNGRAPSRGRTNPARVPS